MNLYMLRSGLACIAVFACSMAFAGTVGVASPDGRNEIRLEDGDSLKCSVWRDGKRRLDVGGIALSVRGRKFPTHFVSSDRFSLSGEERTPIYKKSSVSLAANGCRVALGGGFSVELVARDDGVAYRFSTDFADGEVLVDGETADVAFPEHGTSLWIGYPDINIKGGQRGYITGWEPVYTNLSAVVAGSVTNWFMALPLVVEYGDGSCVCVTESDQRDYPGWMLRGSGEGGRFRSEFAREPVEEKCTGTYHHGNMTRHDYIARTNGRRTYPWRLFSIAKSCAKLCEGDAPYALAQPCQLDDVSWIRPGLVQWDWWHARNLTQVGFRAGVNTATYLYYVDFAADNGIPYVIVDGGWSADYNVLNHKPEIDIVAVAERARARGVSLVLWTPWAALIGRQEETFAAYERIGVKGAKVDGISRNDRYLAAFLEETARIAARHHIVIDYHGVSKPSGLSRAYPNVLTYEGVHGLENTKWEGGGYMEKCDFPRNDLTCLFCRMPAGPMDYTPGAMRNFAKGLYRFSNTEPGSDGTRARQLAMYVMYESPLQMLSDSPTLYMENRECFDFMRSVPTVWDETRGLDGRIGEWAVIARRSGETWYVGAMTDWAARELDIPTDFLGGGEWQADAFADGVNADRNGTDWRRQTVRVRAGEKIRVSLAPGGGWVARIARAGSCPRPASR